MYTAVVTGKVGGELNFGMAVLSVLFQTTKFNLATIFAVYGHLWIVITGHRV